MNARRHVGASGTHPELNMNARRSPTVWTISRLSLAILVLGAWDLGTAWGAPAAGENKEARPEHLAWRKPPGPPPPGDRPLGEPFRPRGPRPGLPPPLWARMSEPERRKVEAFIEEHFPRMFLELQRLKDRRPDRFERRVRRIVPEILHLMEMMEVHPQRGALMIQERQLDIQIRQVVTKFRAAKDDQKRRKLRKQLRQLCERSFDCRHERRALEVRELEARLAELHNRLEEAEAMREQLIEREVKERLNRE